MVDYKKTLNLPKTKFPMKANLPKNEPKIMKYWDDIKAYQTMIQANDSSNAFVLHDGPPYANGHIHLGTAMNKILKDIIVKSQNLLGQKLAEYVPGWDCHGLPIELKAEQELENYKQKLSTLEVRQRCRDYALKYLDIQRNEFKRLGVFGKWEEPYLTMDPAYETTTAMELVKFMETGSVIRNKKPIYWCPSCQTALAEAEVEYYEHESPSIYVAFPLDDPKLKELFPSSQPQNTFILIWTTTPWTLPGNLAIAVHPDLDYVLVREKENYYVLARKLLSECSEKFGWPQPEVLRTFPGFEIEGLQARHPIYSRRSQIVLADYVTLDTGTGCVHTAPGHGQEDYETGLRYGLDIYAPVDEQGQFDSSVEYFSGLNVFEANSKVIEKLNEFGRLIYQESLSHSYPHCWRCKKPIIFRATTQWFISMEKNNLRYKTIEAIDRQIQWIPSWGKFRIRNMIEYRPDWCISRQRSWGVPIVALICQKCGQAFYDPQWVKSIAAKFNQHPQGADYWFQAPLSEVVPEGLICENCGSQDWRKETDILDVWFDSGTSYAAVLEQRPECSFPADMYLEGSDQHRGWFHSSLLASINNRETPPYRAVLTHGFVVDGEGKKMSKSLGNVIAPQEIIEQHGSEILRMWTASENYQEDLRISPNIIRQLTDNYRRIRNTCRYLLGNLYDFSSPDKILPFADMLDLDRYVLQMIQEVHHKMITAYLKYELHKVFHNLHNLCVNDLSAFYLDIIKDRLYVSLPDSRERRSAQTALYYILFLLLRDMAPILSFTAEEVYQNLPEGLKQDSQTVFGLKPIDLPEEIITPEERDLWDFLSKVRTEVTKAIEPERKNGVVGHSLNTMITLYGPDYILNRLNKAENSLREFFIVSKVNLDSDQNAPAKVYQGTEIPELKISVAHAPGQKCERCWNFDQNLGQDPNYPTICPRCSQVMSQLSDV